jgi:hypothetical protein
VIECFRVEAALLASGEVGWFSGLGFECCMSCALLFAGVFYFRVVSSR